MGLDRKVVAARQSRVHFAREYLRNICDKNQVKEGRGLSIHQTGSGTAYLVESSTTCRVEEHVVKPVVWSGCSVIAPVYVRIKVSEEQDVFERLSCGKPQRVVNKAVRRLSVPGWAIDTSKKSRPMWGKHFNEDCLEVGRF